ncbi:hypothetical protein RHSIM_Rhsim10G0056700 [Rhododendron simsii]|uniref:Bifunctional inhibitor/plant lipid transfer protein/seed storage helical domain-containing protein n=1 Tax=Rhododendron simsii TaxID=118357 RepID=A0A834LD79_RHOSS|nr:hypothetical protein RHSIM_Rhsim10G0056700 [Rhododendron simsii]
MAIKTTIPILLTLTAVLFAADVCMAATAPVPAADCSSIILDMADCLSYVSGDATVKKPEGNCCSGLKKVLKTHAECLCEGFKNAAQFGVTLNMTRALDLPSACRVSAPPVSDCGWRPTSKEKGQMSVVKNSRWLLNIVTLLLVVVIPTASTSFDCVKLSIQ